MVDKRTLIEKTYKLTVSVCRKIYKVTKHDLLVKFGGEELVIFGWLIGDADSHVDSESFGIFGTLIQNIPF